MTHQHVSVDVVLRTPPPPRVRVPNIQREDGPFASVDVADHITFISSDPQDFFDIAAAFAEAAEKLRVERSLFESREAACPTRRPPR